MDNLVILWYHSADSDKLWGYFNSLEGYIYFWGRRNKELAFKKIDEKKVLKKCRAKLDSGYKVSSLSELTKLNSDFTENFQYQIMMNVLGENFRR